jgi:hypothetical protein
LPHDDAGAAGYFFETQDIGEKCVSRHNSSAFLGRIHKQNKTENCVKNPYFFGIFSYILKIKQ